jgi:hypothetical protein
MKGKCPNCGAQYLNTNDHDTGKSTPNQWLCDTFQIEHEQPVFHLTYKTGRLIQAFLMTHSDPNAKELLSLFDA